MAAQRRPTAEDRLEAIRITLHGIAAEPDPLDVVPLLAPLHPKNNTFPGEVLLELAADALDEAGASRGHPIPYEGIRERYLLSWSFGAGPSITRATTPFKRRR